MVSIRKHIRHQIRMNVDLSLHETCKSVSTLPPQRKTTRQSGWDRLARTLTQVWQGNRMQITHLQPQITLERAGQAAPASQTRRQPATEISQKLPGHANIRTESLLVQLPIYPTPRMPPRDALSHVFPQCRALAPHLLGMTISTSSARRRPT